MAFSDSRRYYQILELEPGASAEEVNQAYKDLAFVWHPDRIPDDNPRLKAKAQEKLKQLNEARGFFRAHFRQRPSSGAPAERTVAQPHGRSTAHHHKNPYHAGVHHHGASHSASNGANHSTSHGTNHSTSQGGSAQGFGANGQSTPKAGTYGASANGSSGSSTYGYSTQGASTGAVHGPGIYPEPEPFAWKTPRRSPFSSHPPGDPTAETTANRSPEPPPRRPRPPIVPPQWQDQPPPRPAADLSGVKMRGANLRERDFASRNLSGADLAGADLTDAFMHRVNLSGANLSGARLFRANLLQANLSGADLSGTDLIGADLSGADLRGANLTNAKMTVGGRLMVRLTGAKLDGAIVPADLRRSP
ncbi:MAG: pentapeptide repeat-containing protein [Limnothrix sp. BL-A-16]